MEEQSKVVVYLGHSPNHAQTVALVLNIKTGRVSPQFHVVMDPTFSTVNGSDGNFPPASDWQAQCGFTGSKSKFPAEIDQALEPIFVDSSETAQTDLPQEEQEPDEQEQTEGEVGDETEEKGAP